jgi:hypothetical protein
VQCRLEHAAYDPITGMHQPDAHVLVNQRCAAAASHCYCMIVVNAWFYVQTSVACALVAAHSSSPASPAFELRSSSCIPLPDLPIINTLTYTPLMCPSLASLPVLQPSSSAGEAEAQVEAPGAVAQQLFHGCQVCRMLPDYNSVQPQPVSAAVQQLLYGSGNTNWWQVPLD